MKYYGKCLITECTKPLQHRSGMYCAMHLARVRRNGYPELKKDAYQMLEKLPHHVVDDYITRNSTEMTDNEIVDGLKSLGFTDVSKWNVGYRRRRLGIRKYLRGEIQKHKAWVRLQAIKKYGSSCELCGFSGAVDTHHIIPKYEGGPHEIDNLTVICPNCHALITRGKLSLKNRGDISKTSRKVMAKIKKLYGFL